MSVIAKQFAVLGTMLTTFFLTLHVDLMLCPFDIYISFTLEKFDDEKGRACTAIS
jgi:hypothetical protein